MTGRLRKVGSKILHKGFVPLGEKIVKASSDLGKSIVESQKPKKGRKRKQQSWLGDFDLDFLFSMEDEQPKERRKRRR